MRPESRIIHGDCVEVMRKMASDGAQAQAIVTDPPYHLTSIVDRFGKADSAPARSNGATGVYARASAGFMGQTWDGGDVAFRPETWRAAYDLLLPGGHMLVFGGSRTYHRMACAVEDAGFEVRDQILWIYGTGFPKSRDLSKALDSEAGAERTEVVGTKLGRPGMAKDGSNQRSGFDHAFGGKASGTLPTDITAPATDAAKQWAGWGTALKPAVESILLARKPLVGTVAQNVLAHGVGAVNVDACRIPGESTVRHNHGGTGNPESWRTGNGGDFTSGSTAGRFPANLVHSGDAEVEAAFAVFGSRRSAGDYPSDSTVRDGVTSFGGKQGQLYADTGSASRFFFSAKAGWHDRVVQCRSCGARSYGRPDCGCVDAEKRSHPTTKPLSLMRWLVRMITPPGGLVLDPFAGSGTTIAAAALEGFHGIGIELQEEHVGDAVFRMANLPEPPPEPKPAPTKRAANVARTRAIIRAKAPEPVRQASVDIGLFSFGRKSGDEA